MSDYRPVACDFYDLFEIACLRRQRLLVRWRRGAVSACSSSEEGRCDDREQEIEPLGLVTRDGAEWLSARDLKGRSLTLRLDWIAGARPVP
ncbi:MAG: transcriptional antiterminator, Rof [Chromatiaceae bacterium]